MKVFRTLPCALLSLLVPLAGMRAANAAGDSSLAAALDFQATGDFAAAALDYRRAAAEEDSAETRAHLYLAAAEAYRRTGRYDRMAKMLDRVDEEVAEDDAAVEIPLAWLRMAHDEARGDWPSAQLRAESFLDRDGADASSGAGLPFLRHAAANALRAGDYPAARRHAAALPDAAALESIDRHAAGRNRSPRLGGLLGLVPGMGYAYSGEWGNMARSLLLNGLFGWAMVETASRDQWALFSAAAFFELTWYTGSIYGGIDAAHRANRDRLDAAAADVLGPDEPEIRPSPGIGLFRIDLAF
ncbi:MAG: tetratricopeptide repeat protein [Kiritimatiellia bacterium]|jgi:tetratricopeptide (TPR) repeat protein